MNYIYHVWDTYGGDMLGTFTSFELADKFVNSLHERCTDTSPSRFTTERDNLDDFTIPDWI